MKYRYIDNLYTDIPGVEKFQKKLSILARKKPDPTMFLITVPLGKAGLLEIYPQSELLQPYYRKQRRYLNILGITSSRKSAVNLIPDILNDILDECGTLDVKQFMKNHLVSGKKEDNQ